MSTKVTIKRILLGWIVLIVLVALFGKVSVAESDGGRTAANFLLIGPGARAAGMAGAYTAVCDGAVAAYWNPAGLTGVEGGEAALGHFALYQDITLEYGAVAYRLNDKASLAASITFLSYGKIQGYDASGSFTNDITAYDWAGAVSYAYETNDKLSLGATGKFVNQKLDDISGSTFAVDLGVRYTFRRFSLAGFIGNIGPNITFESISERLPTVGRVGVAVYPLRNDLLLTSLELEKSLRGGIVIRHGFELDFQDQYFVRTGYNYFPDEEKRSFGSGISVGVGLRLSSTAFDYAFTLKEKYASENLHRVSVHFKFGNR